ncbi:glycosyltransferase family 2 protein [Cryomorphaceae bacterium 1068]|nr:glycosyltransferase family 2 protein [Cryomorphaceae bacterium 1068]
MKVSVIIPLYNQARFVKRAVESALSQPETAEVLVIDDGSDDDGATLVQNIFANDSRVKCLLHSNGGRLGAGAARNLGIKNATQPFLAFLDADDYMMPNRFVHTREVFTTHPDADGVFEALGQEGSDQVTMLRIHVDPGEVFHEMEPFGKNGHFSVCGLTVKSHAVRDTGGFSERLEIGEDTEWLARLVLTHKIYCGDLKKVVALRTVDGRNTTSVSERTATDKVLMAAMLMAWAKSEDQPESVQRILLDLYLKYHYEENRLLSKKSALSRKLADFKAALFVMKTSSDFWKIPKVQYFLKTVVGLPVKNHLDYYVPSGRE